MKFLVVIPTVRQALPGFETTMATVRASLTQPTELHVLDGRPSKPDTLNRAYDELLTPWPGDFYVTMDDDYLPAAGWQDLVLRGAEALPEVGAFGVWLGDSKEMLELMGARRIGSEDSRDGVRFRRILPGHHLAGAMIIFRRQAALAVGKQPPSELNYQVWEDAWRGRRVVKAGWQLAYLVAAAPPRLVEYPDPIEYIEGKTREAALGKRLAPQYFREGGVGDPWTLRLRHAAGRLKARLRGR